MVQYAGHYSDSVEMAPKPVVIIPFLTLKRCLILVLALAFLMHWLALPKMELIEKEIDGKAADIGTLMPAGIGPKKNNPSAAYSEVIYSYEIYYRKGQQTSFHLYPKGCIQSISLNGYPVNYPLNGNCNFDDGITIDLEDHLENGKNTLTIEKDGWKLVMGPLIFGTYWGLSDLLGYLLIASGFLLVLRLVERLTDDIFTALALACGFLLYVYILNNTTFMWKKYDMPQHLDYAAYIANQLQWPSTTHGFLTYHPPLYYTLQAIVLRIGNVLGSFEVVSLMRFFNVMCFMAFLIFAAMTLRKILKNNISYYLTLVFLVLYPGGVISSVRMDSNLLFYPLYSGCIYFTLCWLDNKQKRQLGYALAMAGLSMAVRSNALLLLPIIGLAGLYQWKSSGFSYLLSCLKSRKVRIGLLVLLLGCLVNFGRPAYEHMDSKRNYNYIVANADYLASIARGLRINNEWKHYTSFDFEEFLSPPYFTVWSDKGGRRYFWVTAIKSSLYGEFSYPNPWIAVYLNLLMLALIAYIAATAAVGYRLLPKQPEWLLFLITILIPLAGLAANRILHPIACSQDFRYVYPAIASFCGLVGFAIQQNLSQNRLLMAATGIVAVGLFALFSLLFFLKMF